MSLTPPTRRIATGTLLALALSSTLGACTLVDAHADAEPITPSEATPTAAGPRTAASDAAGSTYLLSCEGEPLQEPRSVSLTCDDDGLVLDQLRWSGWGTAEATSTGAVVLRNGSTYAVDVRASDLTPGEATQTYGEVTITAFGERPAGTPEVQHLTLSTAADGAGE